MKTTRSIKQLLIFSLFSVSILLTACEGTEPLTPSPSATTMPSATATSPPPTPTPTSAFTTTTSPTETASTRSQAPLSQGRVAFISETYPDNSVLKPGESFTKAYELRNAGSTTWGTDYALVRDETIPAGEILGSPERLPLPQTVAPGETLTLQIPLVAPKAPGTYTVYWTLQDDNGNILPVDGVQRVWVTIRVCEAGQDCSVPLAAAGGGSASAHDITVSFVEVTHEGGMIHIEYCVTVANPDFLQYVPGAGYQTVIVDGKESTVPGGGFARPVYEPIPGYNCFIARTAMTSEAFNQAQSVILRVGKVEGVPRDQDANCEIAKPALMAQYPGLDFQCDYSSGSFGLQLPAGMSEEEAHLIIVDTITGAVYGPWDITIK